MINCEAQRELLRNYQHAPLAISPTPGASLQVAELEAGLAPVAGSPLVAPLPLAPPLRLLALDLSDSAPRTTISLTCDEEKGKVPPKMGPVRYWTIGLLLLIVSAALLYGYLAICHGRHPQP